MQPVTPVISKEFQDRELVFGAYQTEYTPLPAHRNPEGVLLSRWSLTDEERAAVAAGADIHLMIWSTVQPPVLVAVTNFDRNEETMARYMGLFDQQACPLCGFASGSVVQHKCLPVQGGVQ